MFWAIFAGAYLAGSTRAFGHLLVSEGQHHHVSCLTHADYLFPEAHVRTEFTSLQDVPPAQLHAALVPRCSSAASRLAALKLLKELTSHSSVNLQTGLRLIQQLHLSAEGTASVDNMPIHAIRYTMVAFMLLCTCRMATGTTGMTMLCCLTLLNLLQLKLSLSNLEAASDHVVACRAPLNSFVGLKNGGATCYMNSVFQQLFMQPSIRKMLLAVPESSDDQTDNVFYQMQVIWLCCHDTVPSENTIMHMYAAREYVLLRKHTLCGPSVYLASYSAYMHDLGHYAGTVVQIGIEF